MLRGPACILDGVRARAFDTNVTVTSWLSLGCARAHFFIECVIFIDHIGALFSRKTLLKTGYFLS